MDWRTRTGVGLALLAGGLLLASSGCTCYRPRHGFVLRGDWSLELNRVPWVGSRAKCDQDCGEACSQCTASGCETEGDAGSQPAPARQPLGSRLFPFRGVCRTCGSGRCGDSPGRPDGQVGYHNHPRFHPVPTQPVFSPRPEGQLAMADEVYGDAPRPPAGKRGNAARTETPPVPPEPEAIPAPSPTKEDWKSRGPGKPGAARDGQSWIFSPSTQGDATPVAQAKSREKQATETGTR